MLFLRIAPWTLILICFQMCAQVSYDPTREAQPANPAARHKITGTVVNAVTGEAIPRAVVTIPGGTPSAVMSDSAGQFASDNVPEGALFLQAQRPGFLLPGMPPNRMGNYKVDADHTNFKIPLMPAASLQGRVTNSDDEPLEGLVVSVSQRVNREGIFSWQQMSTTQTDNNGNWESGTLGPGTYIVRTSAFPVYRFLGNLDVNGQRIPNLYPPTFYPNTPDQAAAQLITLTPGGISQADFRLQAVSTYSISGTFAAGARANVHCSDANGSPIAGTMTEQSTGRFLMQGVPPGPCHLVAQTFGQNGQGPAAELDLNVQADVQNVQLPTVETVGDIPVIVNGGPGQGSSVNLILRKRNADGSLGRSHGMDFSPGPDGKPEPRLHAVTPGAYAVRVNSPTNTCFDSVTYGGADIFKQDLVLSGGAAGPITVNLRDDCGTLVPSLEGEAPPASYTLIIAGGPAGTQSQFVSTSGQRQITLSPGNYTLYAFDDVSDVEWAKPDVLAHYSGQSIAINPNAKTEAKLKLLRTGTGSGQGGGF